MLPILPINNHTFKHVSLQLYLFTGAHCPIKGPINMTERQNLNITAYTMGYSANFLSSAETTKLLRDKI